MVQANALLTEKKKEGVTCTLCSHQVPIISKSFLQESWPELRLAGGKLCCSLSEPRVSPTLATCFHGCPALIFPRSRLSSQGSTCRVGFPKVPTQPPTMGAEKAVPWAICPVSDRDVTVPPAIWVLRPLHVPGAGSPFPFFLFTTTA